MCLTFLHLLALQRVNETMLYEEEMVTNTLRFYNFMQGC